MSEDSKKFIESLKEYNKSHTKDIYIPSLMRSVKFYPMTAKHQKYLIESALDNPIFSAVFHQKVYDIIKEVCSEPEVVDMLNVFDKDAILIQLRYNFIDKTYDEKDMSSLIDEIKSNELTIKVDPDSVNEFEIEFKIPTIKEDAKIYSDFLKSKSYIVSPSSDDEVRQMLANMYIIELCKYISRISIAGRDASMDFKFHGIEECMEIVDHLGKDVAKAIEKFIKNLKDKNLFIYKLDEDTTVEINSELFS